MFQKKHMKLKEMRHPNGCFFFYFSTYIYVGYSRLEVYILDLFQLIATYFPWLASVALILSVVFQVSKIPINPWGWLLRTISSAITKEVNAQLKQIEEEKERNNKEVLDSLTKIREDIAEIYKTLDLDKIDNIRGEILNFADSIYNGENHSREQYHRIIEKNGTYHELLEKRNLTNGVLDLAMQTILNSYQEHEENNSFIS